MANVTENFGLTKPLPEEFYDVEVQNSNMDIIDAQLKLLSEDSGVVISPDEPEIGDVWIDTDDSVSGGEVLSVNGKTGEVNLTAKDLDAYSTGETYTKTETNNLLKSIAPANIGAAVNSFGLLTETNLLTWAKKQTSSGAFTINPSVTTEGVPVIGRWWAGFLNVHIKDSAFSITLQYSSNGSFEMWTNMTVSGEWIGWKQLSINGHTHTPSEVGAITFYDSLSKAGVTKGSETIETVVSAMGNNSVLWEQVNTESDGHNPATYPTKWGLLMIEKKSNYRVRVEYLSVAGGGANQLWEGLFYSGAFYGWREILTASNDTSGGARVQTGSYTGDGNKPSSASPKSLTFSFAPKIVFIMKNDYGNNSCLRLVPVSTTATITGSSGYGGGSTTSMQLTSHYVIKSGNTVSWYPYRVQDTTAATAFNESSMTYYWVAIG